MWRLADQQLDEFVADGRCEFITRLRPALRHARGRRPARRARGGPPALPRGLRPAAAPSARSAPARSGSPGHNPLAWLDDVVRRLHRGPPARAPQGRAHRPGAGDLPRRQHPRRHRGGAHRHVPLRRRPGDHRPPARRRAQAPRRAPRAAGRAARRPGEDPQLPRGGAAGREPGEDRLPPHPAHHRRSAASRSRPARRSCSSTAPPTATPAASSARTSSASTGPTPPPTWPSGAAPTRAPAARWPGPRAGEPRAHPRPDAQHPPVRGAPRPAGARRFSYEPTWILRGLTELHLEFDPIEAAR